MRWVHMFFLTHLILSFFTFAWADEAYQIKRFRVAPVAAIQDNGISYSTFISWNPEYALNSNWKTGLNLGVSAFETKSRKDYFVTEYQFTLTYLLNSRYGLELGLGQQYWFIDGGNAAMSYSGSFFYFTNKDDYYVDNIFIGVSYLDLSSLITREIKLGVGFSF